jgi:hypothetical protein
MADDLRYRIGVTVAGLISIILIVAAVLSRGTHARERATTERHLAQAEVHVAEGKGHLGRQKQILAEPERDGHGEAAQTADDLLATFECTQESHVRDRDRLRAELASLS